MTRRLLVSLGVVVGCFLVCDGLSTPVPRIGLPERGRAEAAQLKTDRRPETSIAELQSRVDQLEKELRAVKRNGVFVGLSRIAGDSGKPDAVEIEVLRELVEARLLAWRMVYAKYKIAARGGSALEEAETRQRLQVALARLACAEGQDKVAVEHLQHAVKTTEHMYQAVKASYDQGTTTLDWLLEAQAIRADIKLILHRAGGTLPEANVKRTTPWKPPEGTWPQPYEEKSAERTPAQGPTRTPPQSLQRPVQPGPPGPPPKAPDPPENP